MNKLFKIFCVGVILVTTHSWAESESVPEVEVAYQYDFSIQGEKFKLKELDSNIWAELFKIEASNEIIVPLPEEYKTGSSKAKREEYAQYEKKLAELETQSKILTEQCLKDKTFLELFASKLRIWYFNYNMNEKYGNKESFYMPIIPLFLSMAKNTQSHSKDDQYFAKLVQDFKMKSLIEELLKYHAKIVTVEQWEEKFKKIGVQEDGIEASDFYDNGFEKSQNECYHGYVSLGDKYGEYSITMDGWLYSFWMRRYNEGNLEFAKNTLEWLKGLKK